MGQAIRKALIRLDFFSAPAILRAKQEGKSSSTFLGIFSILLFGLCGAILFSKLAELFRRDTSQINYSSSFKINLDQKQIKNIMFGISFQTDDKIKFQDYNKYFKMSVTYNKLVSQNTYKQVQLTLRPCYPKLWQLLGDDYEKNYAQNNIDKYYCLPESLNFIAKGDSSLALSLQFSKCVGSLKCKKINEINAFYQQIVAKYQYFPIYVTFLEPYAQLSDKTPLKYKLSRKLFGSSQTEARSAFIMINSFKIQIDSSILPIISNQQQQNGYNFGQSFYSSSKFEYLGNQPTIFTMNLFLSKSTVQYYQSYARIDEILSYVGGLLGIIGFFLLFLLRSYSEYRYELLVAENSFSYNAGGYKVKQSDFSIFVYLKFRLYFWCYLLFGKLLNDKQCMQIHYTLKQARKLLQVSHLFRRIQVLQRVLWKTNNRNILLISALKQYQSIQKVQKKRLTLAYYQKIINMSFAATVEDAIQDTAASFKYLQDTRHQIYLMKQKKQNKQMTLDRPTYFQNTGSNKQIKNENLEEKQMAIKQSLMKHLALQQFPQLCQKISHYTIIAQQAQLTQLQQQYNIIQEQLTKSFINLYPTTKYQLMQKIPLKIIFRLRNKAIQLQNNRNKEIELEYANIKTRSYEERNKEMELERF